MDNSNTVAKRSLNDLDYPFDAECMGETVHVWGPARHSLVDESGQRRDTLMVVEDSRRGRFLAFAESIMINGTPLTEQVESLAAEEHELSNVPGVEIIRGGRDVWAAIVDGVARIRWSTVPRYVLRNMSFDVDLTPYAHIYSLGYVDTESLTAFVAAFHAWCDWLTRRHGDDLVVVISPAMGELLPESFHSHLAKLWRESRWRAIGLRGGHVVPPQEVVTQPPAAREANGK